MATLKEIKELALHAAKRTAPTEFSAQEVNEALREELIKLAGDFNEFRRNKLDIFEIIQETADEILPKKVIAQLGMFAEVRTVGNGQKIMFTQSAGKQRAKQFLTKVGLSGVYETFRLDKIEFEVQTDAVGIAAYLDFERMLTGAEEMADSMEVIVEALTDSVFYETQRALRAAIDNTTRPTNNKVISNTFESDKMAKLVATAKAYGDGGAVIFAPPEFVIEMGADAIVPGNAGDVGRFSPQDIEDIRSTGYINLFRGTPIVQINQSFTDETNVHTAIDPQMAYVFPTGKEKIVKVVIEGSTIIDDWRNRDRSMEIQAYRKFGVAILTHHNWCIYQNTGIEQTYQGDAVGV